MQQISEKLITIYSEALLERRSMESFMINKHYAVYVLFSILLLHNAITDATITYAPDGTPYDSSKPMGAGRVQRKEADDSSQVRHAPSQIRYAPPENPFAPSAPPQNPFAPAETGTAGIQNKNPSRSSTSGLLIRTQ